jgi:rubrerythrin
MMEHPLFRASELLDMAIQIEVQGREFYENCLNHATDASVRETLEFLANEERKHVEVFAGMKEGLEPYVLPESYSGEMQAYIDSFAKDQVFTSRKKALEHAESLRDAQQVIDLALSLEKRSILFYSAMKQVLRASESEVTDHIIAEEHAHIRRLLALLKDLEQ